MGGGGGGGSVKPQKETLSEQEAAKVAKKELDFGKSQLNVVLPSLEAHSKVDQNPLFKARANADMAQSSATLNTNALTSGLQQGGAIKGIQQLLGAEAMQAHANMAAKNSADQNALGYERQQKLNLGRLGSKQSGEALQHLSNAASIASSEQRGLLQAAQTEQQIQKYNWAAELVGGLAGIAASKYDLFGKAGKASAKSGETTEA